jgi:hypothetical protein
MGERELKQVKSKVVRHDRKGGLTGSSYFSVMGMVMLSLQGSVFRKHF